MALLTKKGANGENVVIGENESKWAQMAVLA